MMSFLPEKKILIFCLLFLKPLLLLAESNNWRFRGDSTEFFRAPSEDSWRGFEHLDNFEKRHIWTRSQGVKRFSTFAWQWRLAWVRPCSVISDSYCADILRAGLQDPHPNVQAEAITRAGQRYARSNDATILRLLDLAAKGPSSRLAQAPFFMSRRIQIAKSEVALEPPVGEPKTLAHKHKSTRRKLGHKGRSVRRRAG
jgi:hypothetical protein